MKFWLKSMLNVNPSEAKTRPIRAEDGQQYVPSAPQVYSGFFALLVAEGRHSNTLEPRDALAGIYIASAEYPNMLRYWKDPENFQRLVFSECGPLNPRLLYWSDLAHKRRRPLRDRFVFRKNFKTISPDLDRTMTAAIEYALRRGPAMDVISNPAHAAVLTKVAVLNPEDILLAIIRSPDLSLSSKLASSGIDLGELEIQVLKRVEKGEGAPR
jgi:hypothetical protein